MMSHVLEITAADDQMDAGDLVASNFLFPCMTPNPTPTPFFHISELTIQIYGMRSKMHVAQDNKKKT